MSDQPIQSSNATVVSFFDVAATGAKNTTIRPRGSGRRHDQIAFQLVINSQTGGESWDLQGRLNSDNDWEDLGDPMTLDGEIQFDMQLMPFMRIRQKTGGIAWEASYHILYDGP